MPSIHSPLRSTVCLFALIAAFTAGAADPDASADPAAPTVTGSCSSAHFREFDFWIGEWEVEAKGKVIASNSISRSQNGCVIHERYRLLDASYEGQSLSIYDPTRAGWHQTWVDNAGTLLLLDGGWKNGAMVLEGRRKVRDVDALAEQSERITWTPASDGSVRQHWETRKAGGEWQTAFDGRYRKRQTP